MQLLTDPAAVRAFATHVHSQGKTLALVPALGPLHAGQHALMLRAKELADVVIVGHCLNKLQLGLGDTPLISVESTAADEALCEAAGVDVLFRPSSEAFYPADFSTYLFEDRLSKGLLGPSRPNWFRGFITLFSIYNNLLSPDWVVVGQRDFQTVAVLKKAIRDLYFPVQLAVCSTVRSAEGLAVCAKNSSLFPSQRQDAERIYHALQAGKRLVDTGIRSPDRVVAEMTHLLSQSRRIRIIYAAAIDNETLEPLKVLEPGHGLLAVAVWLDEVRLLDNILL